MEKKYVPFEDLQIWMESMRLCYEVYDALITCRDFGLRNQLQRCSVSVPSNISEGYELNSNRGFLRHLYIAKGSCAELRTQLYIAIHAQYIDPQHGHRMVDHAKKVSSMIQNFIKERKKQMLKDVVKSILLFLFPG